MNDNGVVKIISRISLFFFAFLLIQNIYFYTAVKPNPWEGDSIDYHIPIAERLMYGQFVYTNAPLAQQYYPSSNELILAIYKIANLPINTFNILSWVILTIACYLLAKTYKLSSSHSLLFATTIGTLNVIVRWVGAQTIDIWLAIFFVTSLILLEKPKKTIKYSIFLGVSLGMLLGSKYTAVPFVLVLLLFYGKRLFETLKGTRVMFFLIPFFLLGLSWYIRNYILFDNPFYPLSFLFFKGTNLFTDNVYKISLAHPIEMINAFIAEYRIWALAPITALFVFFSVRNKKKKDLAGVNKLILLSFSLFIFYPFFPTSELPWIMVSSLRYSYPVFILMILTLFIFSAKAGYSKLISYIAIGNMVLLHPLNYYPKLTFLFIPIVILIIYFTDKEAFLDNKEG